VAGRAAVVMGRCFAISCSIIQKNVSITEKWQPVYITCGFYVCPSAGLPQVKHGGRRGMEPRG